MKRRKENIIANDLKKKMVFITGPRQVGKTWLAKKISENYLNPQYLNYDRFFDRRIIHEESWLPETDLLIFDEIHKMRNWKNFLKGIYDTKSSNLHILVTGSARLEAFHKSGDSLAGRYFLHHLMPFTPFELSDIKVELIPKSIRQSGFPEPLLAEEISDIKRWRNFYINGLLREDIVDFSNLMKQKELDLLLELIKHRVSSNISLNSLSGELQVSPNTIKRYIDILESLHIVFRVIPFSKNISRAILKEPKLYFYDTGMVMGNDGQILENAVAIALKDFVLRQFEENGEIYGLHYIRTKEKKEIDFCITHNNKPVRFIEVKNSDANLSKTLVYFHDKYDVKSIQLVGNLKNDKIIRNIEIRNAYNYLKNIDDFLCK